MGQKINPNSYRLGITKGWPVRWFIKGGYPKFLAEDEAIRNTINKKIGLAGIANIEIERTQGNLRVYIRAARPGLVIGRGGKGMEDLNKAIADALRKVRGPEGAKSKVALSLNVDELKRTEVSSKYLAQQIAWDLEKRIRFRRTMKKYLETIMQNRDVKGAKIKLSGRLDGNEIARREHLSQGALPLATLRANIDYGTATAYTTYGTIGVRVWIYKGEVFNKNTNEEQQQQEERRQRPERPMGRRPSMGPRA